MSAAEDTQPPHGPTDVEELIPKVQLPHTRLSRALDGFVKGVGDLVSWLWVVLMMIIVLNVVLRYAFGRGYIAFEEIQWHLYAVGWLIGLSYCVQNDSHIRIDILHEQFRPRIKAWVDFIGILVLLMSMGYLETTDIRVGDYYTLVVFCLSGMVMMAAAADLIVFFLAFEVMSIAAYVLAGIWRRELRSSEAA
ncbi:MAG: TRAP transporter small permease subunit, partial [Rhodospirillales bacterium]|nr:TRAP transporter small permease subunit [Rhodospirillales bacterium]